ncbi:membrane protein [Vibrio ishigakensis]|uniref:Membrane protein n=1 Tax=Vibrio ishigakensis TaxID=1481914 RepID=A0A0B8QBK2_9VIBR|nr:membrane protein [Vibrio ishigakensis]
MTENFVRLSYPLALVCLLSFIFELYRYFKIQTDWIALISMSLMVATGLMFSFYFVPEIVHLQAQGPEVTQSPMFGSLHKTSEISFKITAISGLILAYRNLMKLKG